MPRLQKTICGCSTSTRIAVQHGQESLFNFAGIGVQHRQEYASPEYNPIELFWKWLKRKIYGANGFTCIEQLIARIRKFIWHYNENKFA
ncbi:TPA: hypothetical protein ACHJMA_002105 [Legionella pneumophila]